jgi:hypothetical protein
VYDNKQHSKVGDCAFNLHYVDKRHWGDPEFKRGEVSRLFADAGGYPSDSLGLRQDYPQKTRTFNVKHYEDRCDLHDSKSHQSTLLHSDAELQAELLNNYKSAAGVSRPEWNEVLQKIGARPPRSELPPDAYQADEGVTAGCHPRLEIDSGAGIATDQGLRLYHLHPISRSSFKHFLTHAGSKRPPSELGCASPKLQDEVGRFYGGAAGMQQASPEIRDVLTSPRESATSPGRGSWCPSPNPSQKNRPPDKWMGPSMGSKEWIPSA